MTTTTTQTRKAIEVDLCTLDSLIDGEPDDGGLGSTLQPIRERLAALLKRDAIASRALGKIADGGCLRHGSLCRARKKAGACAPRIARAAIRNAKEA